MSTANEIHVNSEYLLQQLENWKLIAAAYGDLIEKDAVLKEFLAFKIDITQGFIEELQGWEALGNETKCKNAIDSAEFFLGQIQALFDRVFAGRYQEKWREMEEECVSSDYIYVFSDVIFS
jgi:hypothetical protein